MLREAVCFADVDSNLITNTKTCPETGSIPAAFRLDGQPGGYLTPVQQQFLSVLKSLAYIVPTTGRATDSFRRVRLGLAGYAIVSFGGVILNPDGKPEAEWHELLEKQSRNFAEMLHHLNSLVRAEVSKHGLDIRSQVMRDDGMDLFLSVKHNCEDVVELNAVSDLLRREISSDWQVHANGDVLALMPPYLAKKKAVGWFLENLVEPDSLVITAGDSLTDLDFMSLGHFALMPTRSQNFHLIKTILERKER